MDWEQTKTRAEQKSTASTPAELVERVHPSKDSHIIQFI